MSALLAPSQAGGAEETNALGAVSAHCDKACTERLPRAFHNEEAGLRIRIVTWPSCYLCLSLTRLSIRFRYTMHGADRVDTTMDTRRPTLVTCEIDVHAAHAC